jgi:hypothetical protein
MGATALDANSTGASNTAVGYAALGANTTANNNCGFGFGAGDNITTGAQIVCVGVNSKPAAVDDTYEIVIGTLNITGKGNTTGFISPNGGAMYNGQNSTVWVATSDRRIKKDIVPNTKGLAAINQIEPKNFYYKSNEELQEEMPGAKEDLPLNKLTTSAIAQELDLIFPEAI